MNELALFAGAGGGILGAHLLGWRTICAVEKEPYCREVLLRRQRDGVLSLFPIWDDCNTFDGRPWRGLVDVVTAGFPCQPFSIAGKQSAGEDERDGWPATVRILGEVRPRFALLENVPGLLSGSHGYFGQVLGGLAALGYDAVWDCFPASAVGAPHRRDRLWVLAYADCPTETERGQRTNDAEAGSGGQNKPSRSSHDCGQGCFFGTGKTKGDDLANADNSGRCKQRRCVSAQPQQQATKRSGWWQTEPDVGRVVNGLAHRVDRLSALGNGQVASVVPLAWNTLIAKI